MRTDHDLWSLARLFFFVTIAMAAVYGGVMGASNWLQGSPFHFGWEFLMMVTTAIKVPVLFLLTLLIVISPIYVSSTFVGAKVTFSQVVTMLLASLAVTTITLASMASVAFFFALTTTSYQFIKLLHVAVFAYAGVIGLSFLMRCFNAVVGLGVYSGKRLLFVAWLLLYMFVGTQLAWVMRPFVGYPGMQYTLFRERTGDFYTNVFNSLGDLLTVDYSSR